MNPLQLHTYHLIPIIIFANILGKSTSYFDAPEALFSELAVITIGLVAFGCSLLKNRPAYRALFVALFTLFLALSLARLVQRPALGTFVTVLYFIITIPQSKTPFSYRRLFLAPKISVAVSFAIAFVFYLSLVSGIVGSNGLALLSVGLACASVSFMACAKLRLDGRLAAAIAGVLVASTSAVVWYGLLDFFMPTATLAILTAAVGTVATFVFVPDIQATKSDNRLFGKPEFIIIAYFVSFALVGTFLLQIPALQAEAAPHSFLDSLFTAMSAVCVTGLIVLDTAKDFGQLGQLVILGLIQFGGLGIVSISAWVLFIFQTKRLSVEHEHTITELSSYRHSNTPADLIKKILAYFIFFETMGTIILSVAFALAGEDIGPAIWRAIFTSVSAFCNAGFAIQTDSLIPYQNNPLVLLTISVLIIAGGFAPLLGIHLPQKRLRKWSLHEKLCVSSTVLLLAVGFVLIALFEWDRSFANMGFGDKLLNAWFQSVTTRTAGFNSVDFLDLREVTTIFMMMLMFVGGNPGSAAGGIKTVTAAVIICAIFSVLRGSNEARAFNRAIRVEQVFKAMAVAGIGLLTGFIAYTMLAMTQTIETIPLLFETVSALGTVGLSLGATSELDEVGKVIVILCMLVGRVGPVTFVLALLTHSPESKWDVPSEDVFVS